MLRRVNCLLFAVLAACAPAPERIEAELSRAAASGSPAWSGLSAPARLALVTMRVQPVGEAMCRSAARHPEARAAGVPRNCAFVVALDADRNLPAIAFQTALPDGRPMVAFTFALVERAANEDELAFVFAHEMAHHIADHAPREARRIDDASAGAGRALAGEGDGSSAATRGGAVERLSLGRAGDRAFLRGFELEADRLGARIAAAAEYDATRGAKVLGRFDGRPGAWYPGDYYPPTRARAAAVLDALSGGGR